jgi:ribosomal-protein-alanine N-acetyltransferase
MDYILPSRRIAQESFHWDKSHYKTDLGYTLARLYWQRGIAAEGVRATMPFGFETMHLHRINADTRMDNIGSVRLLEKPGFSHEGVWRECILNEDGTYQNWGVLWHA